MEELAAFLPCIIIPGFVALVVGVIIFAIYTEKKRTEGIENVAREMGLPFFKDGDQSLIDQLSHFRLFSRGRGKRVYNMIHGDTGDTEVALFDYRFTTGSGKNSSTHTQTVCFIRSQFLNVPAFVVAPEHFFHKVAAFFSFEDIDFDTHPAFSNGFHLSGESEDAIRQLFHPHVLEHFEELLAVQPTVEAAGDCLIYFKRGRQNPDQLMGFLETGYELFGLFKNQKQ